MYGSTLRRVIRTVPLTAAGVGFPGGARSSGSKVSISSLLSPPVVVFFFLGFIMTGMGPVLSIFAADRRKSIIRS